MKYQNRTVLVLGGARSGKSRFAENLILSSDQQPFYLATGRAWDDEMRERISLHRQSRAETWVTREEPLALVETLRDLDHQKHFILVDCLTLWVTNLMMETRDMAVEFDALIAHIAQAKASICLVSNEVGLGIVPDNRMAREFRDHAGRLNQQVAAATGEVFFIAAGLPLKMKG
jgi:adenosylcobinamide kinase/adenosylcobinamide-phosphate guanylyltransferase